MVSPQIVRIKYSAAWILVLVLIFVVVFGSYLMPHRIDPSNLNMYHWEMINGKQTMVNAPYPPNSVHWLGTDARGYDLLSLLLNGAKYTLGFVFLVTLFRFLIGVPLGLYSGITSKGTSVLGAMNLAVSAVPPLVYVFPALYLLFNALSLDRGIPSTDPRNALFTKIAFMIIVLIGIFPVAFQFNERANFYSGKLYILAARTLGAGNGRIMLLHILPQLAAEIVFAFLTDLVQVLFLISQLAVFTLFLGGADFIAMDADLNVGDLFTQIGEWGGLIAAGAHTIKYYPWLIIYPCVFVTVTILILSFFTRQLQNRLLNPNHYISASRVKIKHIVVTVGGLLVIISVVLTNTVQNKSPASDTNLVLLSPKKQQQVITVSKQIMGYVEEAKWQYLQSYVSMLSDLQNSDDPMQVFKGWNEKLHTGYKFQEIGQINKVEQMFIVEIKTTDPTGNAKSWYLELTDSGQTRINSAGEMPKKI